VSFRRAFRSGSHLLLGRRLVPVHGELSNMTTIYNSMGYLFPEYKSLDFEYLSNNCTA
jgi:hypothetical protein